MITENGIIAIQKIDTIKVSFLLIYLREWKRHILRI